MNKNILILLSAMISTQAFAIQEIKDTSLTTDVAKASMQGEEAVVRYNPDYCKTVGDEVCHFFLSHEYGHISLGHKLNVAYTPAEESAADCWVAQNAPENLAKAAYSYFMNEGHMGTWAYGSGKQRAENLAQCPAAAPANKPIVNISKAENQKQTKSSFNHYWADRVFADIERRYAIYFPYSGTYAWEYRTLSGGITYDKKYYNGAMLSEENGGLYYKVFGIWFYWGPIANWRL